MAYESPAFNVGIFQASTSFASTDQYCFVTLSTTVNSPPDVRIVATSGVMVFGVYQGAACSSGDACDVMVAGVSKLRFSSTHAAVAVMDRIYSRNDGTGNSGTTESFNIAALALEGLAADTSGIISVLLTPQGAGSS